MKKIILGLIVVFSLIAVSNLFFEGHTLAAVDAFKACEIETATGEKPTICEDVDQQKAANTNPVVNILRIVLNILSVIAGIAAVILLIVNGLRLVVSNGDTNGVKNARNGIIYVLAGVFVVLFAQMIVVFVLDKL